MSNDTATAVLPPDLTRAAINNLQATVEQQNTELRTLKQRWQMDTYEWRLQKTELRQLAELQRKECERLRAECVRVGQDSVRLKEQNSMVGREVAGMREKVGVAEKLAKGLKDALKRADGREGKLKEELDDAHRAEESLKSGIIKAEDDAISSKERFLHIAKAAGQDEEERRRLVSKVKLLEGKEEKAEEACQVALSEASHRLKLSEDKKASMSADLQAVKRDGRELRGRNYELENNLSKKGDLVKKLKTQLRVEKDEVAEYRRQNEKLREKVRNGREALSMGGLVPADTLPTGPCSKARSAPSKGTVKSTASPSKRKVPSQPDDAFFDAPRNASKKQRRSTC